MTAPLVSVVIPTRNRAQMLRQAVASVVAQTFADIEIIVVDDGSTDHTATVLATLAARDPRILVQRSGQPRGAPAARNRGLELARGEVVALLDDDDAWHPVKLERQLAALHARPEVVAVSCHHRIVAPGAAGLEHRGPLDCTFGDLLWENFLGGASMCAWRAGASGQVRFDESLGCWEDWDLWLRLARRGPVAVVPEVLCDYRVGPHQRITTSPGTQREGRKALLERMGGQMSRDCATYHRARLAVDVRRGPLGAVAAAPILLGSPRVARILLSASRAGRAGWREGDPARGLRRLHELARAGAKGAEARL